MTPYVILRFVWSYACHSAFGSMLQAVTAKFCCLNLNRELRLVTTGLPRLRKLARVHSTARQLQGLRHGVLQPLRLMKASKHLGHSPPQDYLLLRHSLFKQKAQGTCPQRVTLTQAQTKGLR